jgi:excisionase family DNA binding protein
MLLNAKEASEFLGIPEEKLKSFVEKHAIPAYMIAGQFLRFKKGELEILKGLLRQNPQFEGDERVFHKEFSRVEGLEKVKELIRANDLYFIAGITILILLIFILFKFWM